MPCLYNGAPGQWRTGVDTGVGIGVRNGGAPALAPALAMALAMETIKPQPITALALAMETIKTTTDYRAGVGNGNDKNHNRIDKLWG